MTGKQLRNSILQWAIQGKLVPQDPNDEPASVLLEKIRAEKARLVKEGKLKKDKNESIIFRGEDNSHYEKFLATGVVRCIDDEIPFEIPKGWEWCRLNSLCSIFTGATFRKEETNRDGIGVRILRGGNISPFKLEMKVDDLYISCNKVNESILLKRNDIVTPAVTSLESIGKMARINENMGNVTVGGFVFLLRGHLNDDGLSKYLQIAMSSPTTIEFMQSITNKSGQAFYNIGKERLLIALIPIPPYNEQKRITAISEELLPIIEKYEQTQKNIDCLNSEIKGKLKKSILQEAIQGRLVPQIEGEGTAQELLEQIREEKKQLVREGKLKKSALSDSVIFKGADNRYYEQIGKETVPIEMDWDFPSNWQITRLSSVCALIDGGKRAGKHICIDAKYLRGKSVGDYISEGKFVHKNDQIILVDGENSGEVFTVPCDGYMGSTFKQLWVSEQMSLQYVLHFISFYKDLLRNSKKGAAIPHLNKEIFYTLVIGIPPKLEQERIVNRIEQLLQLLK